MLSPTLPSWCDEGNERGVRPRSIPERMLSPTLPPMFAQDHKSPISKLKDGRNSRQGSNQNSRQNSPAIVSEELSVRKREPVSIPTIKIDERKKPAKVNRKENYELSPESTKKRSASSAFNEPIKKARVRSYSSSEEADVHVKKQAKSKPVRPKQGAAAPINQATVAPVAPLPEDHTRKDSNSTRIVASAPTPVSSSKPKLTVEQREKHNKLLMLKMSKWVHLAHKQKHESDKYSKTKPLAAGVIAMDALLVYIVAFDYEDRAELVMRRPKHTRSWSTLVPYIGWLINLLEEGDCRQLIGMCYQIRALIYLRMGVSYNEQICKIVEEGESRKFDELAKLTIKLMKSQESSVMDFKRGLRDLGMDEIETMFPNSWKRRDLSVQPTSRHEGGYRPLEDPYYLPLHSFSSLQEAAALGYGITKEWADKNDIECDWALVRGLG